MRVCSRVYAMARPMRSRYEAELLNLAAEQNDQGKSKRAIAKELAETVAEIAILDSRSVRNNALKDQLKLAEWRFSQPYAYALATKPEFDVAALCSAEAARQYEAIGWCRLPEREWENADRQLQAEVASRLCERYRKALK